MSRRTENGGAVALAAVIMLGTALATIPTPVYALYAREVGLDPVGITATFAAFAAGAIFGLGIAMLTSARFSRRRVYAIAASLQAISALLLALDLGVSGFALGRVITGVGSGLLAASGTAFVLEVSLRLSPRIAAVMRAGAPALAFVGLGLGPLISAVVSPPDLAGVRTVFLVVGFAVAALLPVSLWLLPAEAGRSVVVATTAHLPWASGLGAFAAFMTTGLFGSVTTVLLGALGMHDALRTGLFAAAVFFAGAVGVTVVAPRSRLSWISAGLVLGLVLVALAVSTTSLPLLGLAALLAGLSSGALFARSLRRAVTVAPGSAFRQTIAVFLCAYGGLALPVLGFGFIARSWTLDAAVWVFAVAGAAVCALAVLAARPAVSRSRVRADPSAGSCRRPTSESRR